MSRERNVKEKVEKREKPRRARCHEELIMTSTSLFLSINNKLYRMISGLKI